MKQKKYNPTPVKHDIVAELHKPVRINFKRRRVVVRGINETLQADLVEMIPYSRENKGFKYILVVIDCFSKYVWALPVQSKDSKQVYDATEKISLKVTQPSPKNLQTDQGKEFYNERFKGLMKKYGINNYNVYSTKQASIVERVNRTLKNLMWRQFSLQGNYKWLNILNEVVHKYNNSYHRTIKMKPSQVNRSNEKSILKSAYTYIKIAHKKNKFDVGDHVRISKYRGIFDKGYTPNWSNEIFIVREVKLTNPTTYLLKDEKGENI